MCLGIEKDLSTDKRCTNYLWSDEIGNFRRMTMKSRRKVQKAWMSGTNDPA